MSGAEYFFYEVLMKQKDRLKKLTRCAILIALATVLSLVKIYKLPLGGSITLLSMLPICMISFMYGVKWGIGGAFVYSVIQLALDLAEVLTWGLSPISLAGTVIFDYLLAFTLLGLSGVFRNTKKGTLAILAGAALSMLGRFICHLISGTLIFDIWLPDGWNDPFIYSVCYNGSFMLPELIITAVALVIVIRIPHMVKAFFKDFFSTPEI